jgi:hypothetical protein
LEKTLFRCHFFRYESHTNWPGFEQGLRDERPATVRTLKLICLYIFLYMDREMFILYLTESIMSAIVRNRMKRNAGSIVLPGGTCSDRWALEG